jgi:diguanylate cyclase
MEGISLKSRAFAFAASIGAVAFVLALLAAHDDMTNPDALTRALVAAIICGVLSWASAERAISGIAGSIDAAIERVTAAAHGDLTSPTPANVSAELPELSGALDGLFDQVRANLDSVHALAMFDPVTALANRTNFRREADRCLRTLGDDDQAALFFIDLDNFKIINDTYGHAQGDQLLGMVANRLRMVARTESMSIVRDDLQPIVGRLAGDEFTVLFTSIGMAEDALRIGHCMLAALTEPYELAGHTLEIGASIGIALRPDAGRSLTALMRAADVAMYHAKACGRGQCQLYTDILAARRHDRTRLETEIRTALVRDEFAMLVQPQVSLINGRVTCGEVLMRWNHPVDGVRLPAAFIPAAEQSGLIYELGTWSEDAIARMAVAFLKAGLTQRVAVNLSPRQVRRAGYFNALRETMRRYALPLSILEIELSESFVMMCSDTIISEVAALRAEGATLAIDDFGAGVSSLPRLRQLPVDRVKIDGSLIANITSDPYARTIVQAVIGMVHGLGYASVAEGVETADQLELLRVMGCQAAQGYAIAHPMTGDHYQQWCRDLRPVAAAR